MKKVFIILALLLTLLTRSAFAADQTAFDRVLASKTIRCGYFVWPPYIGKDPNTGKLSGINYEVMEAIGKNLGMKIDWVAEVGAGDVVTALETGKADVFCASVWPNPARIQNMTLTRPTFYSTAHAFTRSGDKRFDGDLSKADRKEVRVAVIEGDITEDLAREKLPNATIVALPQSASGAEILMQLVNKKADIALVDQAGVNDFEKNNPDTLRKVAGIPTVRIFGEDLAVKRGELLLKNMIDEAIQQLTNDGVIEQITRKYAAEYKSEFLAPVRTYQSMP